MKAKDFDKTFDEGKSVIKHLDLSKDCSKFLPDVSLLKGHQHTEISSRSWLSGRNAYFINIDVISIATGVTHESDFHIRREVVIRFIDIYFCALKIFRMDGWGVAEVAIKEDVLDGKKLQLKCYPQRVLFFTEVKFIEFV